MFSVSHINEFPYRYPIIYPLCPVTDDLPMRSVQGIKSGLTIMLKLEDGWQKNRWSIRGWLIRQFRGGLKQCRVSPACDQATGKAAGDRVSRVSRFFRGGRQAEGARRSKMLYVICYIFLASVLVVSGVWSKGLTSAEITYNILYK